MCRSSDDRLPNKLESQERGQLSRHPFQRVWIPRLGFIPAYQILERDVSFDKVWIRIEAWWKATD